MKVEVLGTGCANCRNTAALVEQVAQSTGVAIDLRKVEDMQQIVAYGVIATPAVVIDGKVVHAGGVPRREAVEQWFRSVSPAAAPCCGSTPGRGCCS